MKTFTPDELTPAGAIQGFGKTTLFSTPISYKENFTRLFTDKTPMWIPTMGEMSSFKVDCDPENIARSPANGGGIDGFGVEWIFVPTVGGATVKPGNPKCPDINEWEKYITIPNPDEWDWEGCYERNKDRLRDDTMVQITFGSCLFERLIAILDFQYAAMALIDEDQQEAVHRFFRAVTDYRKRYYYLCKKWFNADIVNFNDDWGSQRAEFFAVDTVREMLMPYVKETCEYVHSLGMFIDLHSCGFVEGFVPIFIEEGMDAWGGQPMNDKVALKKKYGDQHMIFTHDIAVAPDASDEEIDAAVAKFMEEFGYDNRALYGGRDERVRAKLYEASRKNYDRLVAEGKARL